MGLVVAFRDITDALQGAGRAARADKLTSLGLLAGGIAHDFNNILMGMGDSVARAGARCQNSPASRALVEAERSCVHARQLTWQLLTFSKGGVPNERTVALPKILKDSAHLVLRGSNVTCTFNFAPDLWTVTADRAARPGVHQHSAERAAGDAARRQHPGVGGKRGGGESILRQNPISDTGIGIPKENLASIFDPYLSTKQTGLRPRTRELALHHQEPRRLCLGGIDARPGHDGVCQPACRREPSRSSMRCRNRCASRSERRAACW